MSSSSILPEATQPSAQFPIWKIGSLTYTRGGLVVLFSWLLWGDFAWSLRDREVGILMQLMLKKFAVSDTVNALLLGSLPACIGIVLGPVISYCSDRHRGPRGRRIPFLLFSAPIVALAIIGLGLSPFLGRALHEALGARSPGYYPSVIFVLALWWLIYDTASMVTYAVFGAFVNDVVPHSVIGRFYGLFRGVSLLVGITFNFWLLGKAEKHSVALFVFVGAIFGIGVISMCLKVKEGSYPPPSPAEGRGMSRLLRASKLYFKECFTHSYYLWFFAGSGLAMVTFSPVNLFSVFFAKSLGIGMGALGHYLAITYAISLGLAYFLGSLADRIHPLRLGMAILVIYAVMAFWSGCCATTEATFAIALIAHGVISGCYLTGAATLGQRLLPKARYAQFTSAAGLVLSILHIVTPLLVGHLLDISSHNYRLTFFAGGSLALLALGCLAMVHFHWLRHGSPRHFVAPE